MEKTKVHIAYSLLLFMVIVYIDYLQGHRLSMSLFYLAPISLITWYQGRILGFTFSIIGAIIWFIIEYYTRPYAPGVFIMVWNAALRLGFFLITTWLLNALRGAFEREKSLARKDHLTNSWNRFAFDEIAEIELSRALRYKHPVSLAYIDLDDFKRVNDRFGHATGDKLLIKVVKHISSHIRKTDVLCRLGGDEFALLLPETPGKTARVLLERIQKDLLAQMKKNNWPVTFSVGIVSYNKTPDSLKEILHEADMLMYSVKQNGKNKMELLIK